MQELRDSGRKSNLALGNWIPDKETKRRYKRSGAVLGFLLALLFIVSGKLVCQLSTGSKACGIGSVAEGLILFVFVGATLSGLGWYCGSQLSTEHPGLRPFHLWCLAAIVGLQWMLPIALYQLQPQWKTQVWDKQWNHWLPTGLSLIYLLIYRLLKQRFARRERLS